MDIESFFRRNSDFIERMARDFEIKELTRKWFNASLKHEYHYHFSWLGLPIIQFPQDIIVMQELVWKVKPDLIIETGIARGGSLVFYASLLELIGGDGHVIGIDIDIHSYNRVNVEQHSMSKRISMIEGSSIDKNVVERVYKLAKSSRCIFVVLDSNHTHEHVLQELRLYSPLVTKDSYIVIFDTVINDIPEEFNKDRPWNKNNNPKTAVCEFLKENKNFIIDKQIENKLLITVCPDGFLKRV